MIIIALKPCLFSQNHKLKFVNPGYSSIVDFNNKHLKHTIVVFKFINVFLVLVQFVFSNEIFHTYSTYWRYNIK